MQEPALEGATRRVANTLRHVYGHGQDDFLRNVLGLRVAQAALESDAVDEPPAGVDKIAPTGLIIPIAEPVEQTSAAGQQLLPAWRSLGT